MKTIIFGVSLLISAGAWASPLTVASPDGKLKVVTDVAGGRPVYSVIYDGNTILENSPLGLLTDVGDLSKGMWL